LRKSQPGVSKHLRVLREVGLVAVRADGRRRLYALRAAPLTEVDAWLAPYRRHWTERLDALEEHLEDNPRPKAPWSRSAAVRRCASRAVSPIRSSACGAP